MKMAIKPNPLPETPTIFGSDISGDMVAMTRHNLKVAGIMFDVPLKQIEAQEVAKARMVAHRGFAPRSHQHAYQERARKRPAAGRRYGSCCPASV